MCMVVNLSRLYRLLALLFFFLFYLERFLSAVNHSFVFCFSNILVLFWMVTLFDVAHRNKIISQLPGSKLLAPLMLRVNRGSFFWITACSH